MQQAKFIGYYRVSTQRQGVSGLGIEAQQAAVGNYLRGRGELVGAFVEVESGRKGGKQRPELVKALAECKRTSAALVVGKLDRLSRDVRFFLEVLDDAGVDIRFAEFSDISTKTDEGRMILIGMANFAEFEGRRIGTRVKAALAAAKARGVKLGVTGPANLAPNIQERQATADAFAERLSGLFTGFTARNLSQRAMVSELNKVGVAAPRGGAWSLAQVQRLLHRLESSPCRPGLS